MRKYKFTSDIKELKEEMENVWGHANFGEKTVKLHIVKYALLKCASGYSNGYTAQHILIDLKLVTPKLNLTKKGKYWLWEFFQEGYK